MTIDEAKEQIENNDGKIIMFFSGHKGENLEDFFIEMVTRDNKYLYQDEKLFKKVMSCYYEQGDKEVKVIEEQDDLYIEIGC